MSFLPNRNQAKCCSIKRKKVKTKVIRNTTEPKWFFTEDFPIEVIKGQDLKIEIFDYDFIGENDFLGKIIIPTSMVADKGSIDKMWTELENVKSGKIQLSLTWLQATLDKSILQDSQRNCQAQCLLHIFLDSCHNLKSSQPSPFVKFYIRNKKESKLSRTKYYTNDPIFEEGFEFTVIDPYTDDLHIKVIDSGHKDAEMGYLKLPISTILESPNMECKQQKFSLTGKGVFGEIELAISIRCLKKVEKKNKTYSLPRHLIS